MATWNYAGAQNAIAQGDGKDNRDGNQVYSIGMKYNFIFWNNSTTNVMVRMLALQARQKYDYSLESGPSIAPIYDSNGQGYVMSSYTEPQRILNPLNKRNFRVLMDRVITLQSNSAADAKRDRKVSGYVKTRTKLTWDAYYSASKPDRPVYFVFICSRTDGDTVTGAQIEISWIIRHYFKET